MTTHPPSAVALLAAAETGRNLADATWAFVADITEPTDRITRARQLRLHALCALQLAVVAELLDNGEDYEAVAEKLGLTATQVRADYQDAVKHWLGPTPEVPPGSTLRIGFRPDPDPAGTADSIDLWVRRHADIVEPPARPVSRLLDTDSR